MKTCTRCGGNLYVPYAYGCRHDFGEAAEGGVRIAFDPTPSRRAPVGWTVEVERADERAPPVAEFDALKEKERRNLAERDARLVARRQVLATVRSLGGITAHRVVELARRVGADELNAKCAIADLVDEGLIEWADTGSLVECID